MTNISGVRGFDRAVVSSAPLFDRVQQCQNVETRLLVVAREFMGATKRRSCIVNVAKSSLHSAERCVQIGDVRMTLQGLLEDAFRLDKLTRAHEEPRAPNVDLRLQ